MKASVAEARKSADAATRSADAMVDNVRLVTTNSAVFEGGLEKQLRAYLSVVIGSGVYQDREKELKFEVKPVLINSGNTPARKVTYTADVAILPVPLPDDFSPPEVSRNINMAFVLGPRHDITINAALREYVDDVEVPVMKRGSPRSLYIWGRVDYEDVFEVPRFTKFCHSIYLVQMPDGTERILGHYSSRHNDAT